MASVAESELARLRSELQAQIRERQQAEAALRLSEEKARSVLHLSRAQKMEAIGTLAGGIAHDFNNILAVILGNLTLAQNDVGPDHPATESLEQIHRGIGRAAALVQQILAFSRPQSIETRVMTLRASIEEDTRLLRATLPAGVELTTHFSGDAPDIVCHPNAIHQVLVNLCTNAWHAMEGHPGRISLILDDVTVPAGSTGGPASCDLDAMRGSRSPTREKGWTPRRSGGCSSRSSRQSRLARVLASGWPSCMAS